MKSPLHSALSRRDFVKLSAAGTGAAAVTGLTAPRALGATGGSDRIRVGVIGCGGRGTGAAKNCLESAPGVEIVALGDLFENQVNAAQKKLGLTKVEKFWGFDNYQKVLAADIDMVILAAPPGFRPVHFEAAVNANTASRRIHIFTEKPVAVDPVGCRRFIEAARKSKAMGVAVVAGTQRRHQQSYVDTIKRIHDGEMGELVGGQCYWNGGGIWFREKNDPKNPWLANVSDFEWQCWNWYHWDWMCGDHIVEQHIHNIDVMNWAFNGPPVKFTGMGGRQSRGNIPGNIWDHFAVEMEYANGVRVMSMCRHTPKSTPRIAERIVGSKGYADLTQSGVATIKGAKPFNYSGPTPDPYVVEHTHLIESIRRNQPLNEGEQVAISTLTAIGGRISAYTGREVSWKWLMEGSKLDIFPKECKPGPGIFPKVPNPGEVDLV
ncbi:MAG: putative oxidoreductase YvaA [Verrucomicrobiota bacterium]|jgi:predicted dehydrogenase